MVVHGAGGLDEASLEGPNQVRFLENGEIKSETIRVEDLGLTSFPNSELIGGSLDINKQILLNLFKGKGTQAQREVVALNTALVFWASGLETNLREGINLSLNCMDLSKPLNRFNDLKEFLK